MRRDGRDFASGSVAPRRFSDAVADRPVEVPEDIDDVPRPPLTLRDLPIRQDVGFPHLKRRR